MFFHAGPAFIQGSSSSSSPSPSAGGAPNVPPHVGSAQVGLESTNEVMPMSTRASKTTNLASIITNVYFKIKSD